jgi:hypothetical protein
MTWKQAQAEALRLVEQAALHRSELHLTEYQSWITIWLIIQPAERWEITI